VAHGHWIFRMTTQKDQFLEAALEEAGRPISAGYVPADGEPLVSDIDRGRLEDALRDPRFLEIALAEAGVITRVAAESKEKLKRHPPSRQTPAQSGAIRPHILTVALEDYFQVGAFNRFVQKNQWYRFETRLEKNTERTLELLKRTNAKASFFVLGWVAQKFPELIRKVAEAGHEVAIKGYYHRGIREMTPEEFEADCLRAKEAVESATGRAVVGYRLADGWLGPEDLWALDSLAKLGFAYDSSLAPMRGAFADQPYRRFLHPHLWEKHKLWEVPISTDKILGIQMPVAGGNYLRQMPRWLTRRAVNNWAAIHESPIVAYFHVWELDPEQPRLSIGGWMTRVRHYRNLDKMEARLTELLQTYPFTSAAEFLGISSDAVSTPLPRTETWQSDTGRTPITVPIVELENRVPVSIVVPCYNEEESIPYLANTLYRVREALSGSYEVRFILVDDGSSDRTWDGLNATFHGKPGFDLIRHDGNAGVQAAIMTGLKRADTEIVCSMDCDCTYDPLELGNMIPKLEPGIDLVTASPYHPEGHVRNVPGWRLFLSRGAAWLYRRVLKQQLYTYTSCFRVYRKSTVASLRVRNGRYLGVAEFVGRLDLAKGKIVEHPATLEVRMLGRSKMKTVRTIVGHLGLLTRLAFARMLGRGAPGSRDQILKSVIESHRNNQALAIRQLPVTPPPDADDVRRAVLHPGATTTDE